MNLGISFSGGGVKGVAHLGVLKFMQEIGLSPNIVSGTSSGAIVGAFYAYGYPPDEILNIFEEVNLFRFPYIAFGRPGLFNIYRLRSQMEKYFEDFDFNHLQKKLYVHVTNLEKGTEVILHQGDFIKAVFASSAVPFIFAPVEIDNILYTDGGVCNNFPIESIRNKCDILIGVNVEGVYEKGKDDLKNSIRIIERSMEILIDQQSMSKVNSCDLYLGFPELSKYSIFDFKKMQDIFDFGYEKALANKDAFLKLSAQIS